MNKSEFPKKYLKILDGTPAMEEIESLSKEDIKSKIIKCEESLYNIEKNKSTDEKLNSAKALVKDYSASYREAAAYEKAKIQYCLFVMQSRGYELAETDKEDG